MKLENEYTIDEVTMIDNEIERLSQMSFEETREEFKLYFEHVNYLLLRPSFHTSRLESCDLHVLLRHYMGITVNNSDLPRKYNTLMFMLEISKEQNEFGTKSKYIEQMEVDREKIIKQYQRTIQIRQEVYDRMYEISPMFCEVIVDNLWT